MQISTVNRPSTSLKGPVKVPQKEQCGPTPHTPTLERAFVNDSRRRDPFTGFEWGSRGCNPPA
jgi:hypothetical protein